MANRSNHPRIPVEVRFWAKVDKDNGPIHPVHGRCWIWTAARQRYGYGRIAVVGSSRKWEEAHRVSWLIEHGIGPGDSFVLHRCDNPPCVRPDHLFLGDHLANARDRESKGRGACHVGVQNGRHTLTAEEVEAIRTSGRSNSQIAAQYGIGKSQVIRVRSGQAWSSVSVPDDGRRPAHAEVTPRGSLHGNSKTTEHDVIDIRTLKAMGARVVDLAAAFGLGETTVQKIITRATWAHVV